MYSSEGERVQLIQHISTSEAKGAVEKWLVQVEDLMIRSVRDVVAQSRVVRSLSPNTLNNTQYCDLITPMPLCCVWVICDIWTI